MKIHSFLCVLCRQIFVMRYFIYHHEIAIDTTKHINIFIQPAPVELFVHKNVCCKTKWDTKNQELKKFMSQSIKEKHRMMRWYNGWCCWLSSKTIKNTIPDTIKTPSYTAYTHTHPYARMKITTKNKSKGARVYGCQMHFPIFL